MTMSFDSTSQTSTISLIHSTESGDPAALDQLVGVLYGELRAMAHRQLARERSITLHTTELVHEAFLRLVESDRISTRGRAYFFAAASQAMRRVLVDAARRRATLRRGSGERPVTLDESAPVSVDGYAHELLDLDRGLAVLEQESPRLARVVELRFFGGLDVEETAQVLEVSPRTVKSDWALARAWLLTFMRQSPRDTD